ncbi:hypothetical protein L2E82_47348 [Cichorium intybus]|uniref:Uncharacterized protein n=1 Tax=Cichorium intybus TaxID=13427 RepID=A0ACB8YUH4_CICIN|nr:hypothetical protein L2E82_47348 [Cichorium intybus]
MTTHTYSLPLLQKIETDQISKTDFVLADFAKEVKASSRWTNYNMNLWKKVLKLINIYLFLGKFGKYCDGFLFSCHEGCENITPVPSFDTDRMELISHTHGILKDLQVETVADILPAMNATSWRFNGDTCNIDTISEVPKVTQEANDSIGCDYNRNRSS